MHIYAFGSIVRGEVNFDSDVDLIAVVEKHDSRFDPSVYSIYSYNRLFDLWEEGNPFAWHLATESKMIFTSDGEDYIKSLGSPAKYKMVEADCYKFYNLFLSATSSITSNCKSSVFELSTIFLAIRNFATCYSLGKRDVFDFSRYSAKRLGVDSVPLQNDCFSVLERCRILSTRGTGSMITATEANMVLSNLHIIRRWMERLLYKEIKRERVQ